MTRSEIESMEAGPALDKLVAERFMGWEQNLRNDLWMFGQSGAAVISNWFPSDVGRNDWEMVLAKLQEKYQFGFMGWFRTSDTDKLMYEVSVGHNGKVYAETLPLALCRLALLTTVE